MGRWASQNGPITENNSTAAGKDKQLVGSGGETGREATERCRPADGRISRFK